MTPVNGIPPVDIRAYRKPPAHALPEDIRLMRARVGSQHIVLVDVIGIGTIPTRVVWGKA